MGVCVPMQHCKPVDVLACADGDETDGVTSDTGEYHTVMNNSQIYSWSNSERRTYDTARAVHQPWTDCQHDDHPKQTRTIPPQTTVSQILHQRSFTPQAWRNIA